MAELVVCTWLWGSKYTQDHVAKLAAGVRRHLKQRHRFVCFSDVQLSIEGVEYGGIPNPELTKVRGCFARLRMFNPWWQEMWFADRLVCIDLDTVITGPLDPLFDRPEPFCILQGSNAANPCPYGGALMMIRAGVHPEVWSDFSLEEAAKVPFYEFPDDQGWIAAKIPGAAGWKSGAGSGVYVFRKPGWPSYDRKMLRRGDDLPPGARIVTFSGGRQPEKFMHLDWVKGNWRV